MKINKKSILRSQLNIFKPFIEGCSLATVRKSQDSIGKLMAIPYKSNVSYEDVTVGSLSCTMITPKDEISNSVIMYLHGGGFVAGNLSYARGFASVLASKCGVRVFTVEYRLAPEHVYPAALDDTLLAYGYLLNNGYEPSRIMLAGESAGGGLCYSLCLRLRDKGRTMPAGIIAISPWTDLTLSSASYIANEKADPSLTVTRLKYFADCYLYGSVSDGKRRHPKTNPDADDDRFRKSEPYISPLFAELSKMPPSLIFVGGDEIMMDDSVNMHSRLLEYGCESTLTVAPELWHGYILYDLRERDGDFEKIRRFIRQYMPNQKKLKWLALDNAAKIFPAARSRVWSNIFRLSATMSEEIDREALRVALDVTVRRFPSIAVRVKTGVFWYYLEEIPKAPEILDEKPYPLSRMPFDDIRKCAFRVLVHRKRIAVEFFHALTDGNGGLVFLKTLVAEYIYQKYGVKVPIGDGVLDRLEEPSSEELEDSFFKYAGKHAASRSDTDAYKIDGAREADGFRTNTTFIIEADDVVRRSRELGVTVTAFLCSALMLAVISLQKKRVTSRSRYKPVKVLIPVNLRKIFPSKTLRNFVLYATPGVDIRLGDYDFEELCRIVTHQMKLQITEKNMAAMITANVNSERNLMLRAVPLFVKNIVMKSIFNAVGERKSCFSFSNLGAVNMPQEFETYVDRLDFVLGSQAKAPYNTSAITYKGKIYLNVIRNIASPVLEREIYAVLSELGLPHEVESNTREEKK